MRYDLGPRTPGANRSPTGPTDPACLMISDGSSLGPCSKVADRAAESYVGSWRNVSLSMIADRGEDAAATGRVRRSRRFVGRLRNSVRAAAHGIRRRSGRSRQRALIQSDGAWDAGRSLETGSPVLRERPPWPS